MNKLDNSIYRVQFTTSDTAYDLYVRHVYPADMAGFVCIEGFLFNEETDLLIDPRTEKLMQEFGEVDVCFVPYHHIIRIDRVSRVGASKAKPHTDKVIPIRSIQ